MGVSERGEESVITGKASRSSYDGGGAMMSGTVKGLVYTNGGSYRGEWTTRSAWATRACGSERRSTTGRLEVDVPLALEKAR